MCESPGSAGSWEPGKLHIVSLWRRPDASRQSRFDEGISVGAELCVAQPVPLVVTGARRWEQESIQRSMCVPTGLRIGCLPQAPLSPLPALAAHAYLLSCAVPNTFSPSPPALAPCPPWRPSPAHRESSRQLTFKGAQCCRGHLCCGLAQPDGRAGASPPTSSRVPCIWRVAWKKNPEEGAQDGQGHCSPEGEARAMSQEATG